MYLYVSSTVRPFHLSEQGWRAWVTHHARVSRAQTLFLLHRTLSDAFHQWQEWQQRRRKRLNNLHCLVIRKELKVALRLWRLGVIAATTAKTLGDERRRRYAALGRVLRSLFLLKCLRILARNARVQRILRRLVKLRRIQTLRDGMSTWQQRQLQKVDPVVPDLPSFATPNPVTVTTRQAVAKPRKRHCRCVYDVCRGQRCTCAPRLHLLRRVEELHRLVAKGLSAGDGGCRLVSHVAQCVATTTSRSVVATSSSRVGALGEHNTSSDRCENPTGLVERRVIAEKHHRNAHGRKKYQTTGGNTTPTVASRQG